MGFAFTRLAAGQAFTTPPDSQKTWLRPVHTAPVSAHEDGEVLAGGWVRFTHLDVVMKTSTAFECQRLSLSEYLQISADKTAAETALHQLISPRADFATLSLSRPHIMGVLNITPDSFSDGGVHFAAEQAIAAGQQMASDGASVLDIGGESTRPGAAEVPLSQEISRVQPVISALVQAGHIVSSDTRHTQVMQAAHDAGAQIINDVSGFTDTGAAQLLGTQYQRNPDSAYAMAMHMQGTPKTMQQNPHYDFAPLDIYEVLEAHVTRLKTAGLPPSHIVVDPGFGFGKTPEHNRQLIDWTALFHGLGVGVLIGVSRKSSIPKLVEASADGLPDSLYGRTEDERLGGSIALGLEAVQQGAQFIRTHDVAPTAQAVSITAR